jgi:hypothetical protein
MTLVYFHSDNVYPYTVICNCSKRNKPTYRLLIAWQLIAYYNIRHQLRYDGSVVSTPLEIIDFQSITNGTIYFITLQYLPSLVALRFRCFAAVPLRLLAAKYALALASLTCSSSLRSSHSMRRFASTGRYALLRSRWRPCPSLHFVCAGVPHSLGNPRSVVFPPPHPLPSLPAVRHGRSLVFAFPRPLQPAQTAGSVASRFSVSASLRSLVLRTLFGTQPVHVVNLPCCCHISSLFLIALFFDIIGKKVLFIELHSYGRYFSLSPFNVLVISRLCRLARYLDKLGKMHLLYIN